MALFAGNLLPASFRGAPFAVVADEIGGGRRIALHQYPGRDAPWAEDMGRAPRTFRFKGFIVDGDVVFAGGPIQLQRALLIAALEREGAGTLTHPTLGVLSVSVGRFSVGQDLGAGRMSAVEAEFVESGTRTFPSSLLSSGSGLLKAANLCKVALALDGVRAIALAAGGGGRRKDLTATAGTWSARTRALGADATALHRLAAQLPGQYGRFASGARTTATASTLDELVAAAARARTAITAATAGIGVAIVSANLGYPVALPDAVTTLVAALAAACADPVDAIRLLEQLCRFVPPRPEAETPIGAAFSMLVRRAAAAELAAAAGRYQPSSSDDAGAMILRLATLFDELATSAADTGDDQSFAALRAARAAIVQDLRRRGATLAKLKIFTPASALPSVRLAQRYYRDTARADELTAQAGAVHPLFMPIRFQALAA